MLTFLAITQAILASQIYMTLWHDKLILLIGRRKKINPIPKDVDRIIPAWYEAYLKIDFFFISRLSQPTSFQFISVTVKPSPTKHVFCLCWLQCSAFFRIKTQGNRIKESIQHKVAFFTLVFLLLLFFYFWLPARLKRYFKPLFL